MRIGEVVNGDHSVKAKNVHEARNKKQFLLVLYSSKTHTKAKKPQKIYIDQGKHNNFCPYRMIRNYTQVRPTYVDDEENFFVFSDRSVIEPSHVRNVLRSSLKNLGLNGDSYDTHSFRSGRATDLEKIGHSVDYIKKRGRWASNAVYKYLR